MIGMRQYGISGKFYWQIGKFDGAEGWQQIGGVREHQGLFGVWISYYRSSSQRFKANCAAQNMVTLLLGCHD